MSVPLKAIAAVVLALMIVGCASHRTRIDCEGHLRPINAPAPAKPAEAHPSQGANPLPGAQPTRGAHP